MLGAGTPIRAEIVRLKVGRDLFGQGWMFLDQDGVCKVVTAAHVVRGIDGRIRPALALDSRNHEWTVGLPLVVSSDPDIAVLPIPAASTPGACGDGRLSDIGAERRVAQMSDAVIATTEAATIITVPVTRRAASIDGAGGGLFAVRPVLAADQIKKGWSGSVVRDADGPLGIVFEVDALHNEALAVRVDVIRRLMDNAAVHGLPPGPASAATAPSVVGLLGTTIEPASGPQQSLAGSGGSWMVRPVSHAASLAVTFMAPRQMQEITMQNDMPSGGIVGIDVTTQADAAQQDWTPGNYCSAQAGVLLRCRFLIRTIIRVKLTIKTRGEAPVGIAGVSFR